VDRIEPYLWGGLGIVIATIGLVASTASIVAGDVWRAAMSAVVSVGGTICYFVGWRLGNRLPEGTRR
jgi:hypothetical protein